MVYNFITILIISLLVAYSVNNIDNKEAGDVEFENE